MTRDYPGNNLEVTGAFGFRSGSKNTPHLGQGSYSSATGIEFNASYYNPVYKDNAEVTPQNTSIKIWKRVS